MDKQKVAEVFVHLIDQPPENRKEYLGQLKTVMSSVANTDLNEAMVSVSLETLFECLDTNDEEQIQTTCDILKMLMLVMDPQECLSKYEVYILEGFKHPVPSVRAIIFAQLERSIETEEGAKLLCSEYQDLIIATIHQICFDDLSVVKLAGNFLVNLAKTAAGVEFLLGPAGIESFSSILNSTRNSTVVKFRVYEVLVNLARISTNHLEKIEAQNLVIQPLVEIILNADDPLGQLNGLEILANLVDTQHGYEAVFRTDIVAKLQSLSQNWKEDAMSGILFPGVIKFIGKLGTRVVPPNELVSLVLNAIVEAENDISLSTVGIEALTLIGSIPAGKKELSNQTNLNKCFAVIRLLLKEGVQPFRTRVIDALAVLFGSDEQNEKFLTFWFYQIFQDINELFHLVQQPFPDIRLSALNFLTAIAHLEWAQKHYLRIPGVMEFLTNRGIEPSRECALAKFKIVTIIVNSETAKKYVKQDDLSLLKMHYDQGPFYVVAKPTMATEGAS